MGNSLEQDIINLYSDNLSSLYSINQIAKSLGKKYPYINKKVKYMIERKILRKIVIGRSHICTPNLTNDETLYLFILNEIRKKNEQTEKNPRLRELAKYLDSLNQTSEISIALKTESKLILVVPNDEEKYNIQQTILPAILKDNKTEVLNKEEFLTALLNDITIYQKHTILLGFERYYMCLKQIETPFRVKHGKLIPT